MLFPKLITVLFNVFLLSILFTYVVNTNAIEADAHQIKVCSVGKIEKFKKRLKVYNKLITKYSQKYGVSESLIKAVITVESCFNPSAVLPKGAQGLMQLPLTTQVKVL